jgi:hypothetical protein
MPLDPGYTLDQDAFRRTREAVRAHEGFVTDARRDRPPLFDAPPPRWMRLRSRLLAGRVATAVPVEWDDESGQWVNLSDRDELVSGLASSRQFWAKDAVVFVTSLPGLGLHLVTDSLVCRPASDAVTLEPFSCAMIDDGDFLNRWTGFAQGGSGLSANDGVLRVGFPSAQPWKHAFVFTGPERLTVSRPGACSMQLPAWVRYDAEGGAPIVGQIWGPTAGQAELVPFPSFEQTRYFEHSIEVEAPEVDVEVTPGDVNVYCDEDPYDEEPAIVCDVEVEPPQVNVTVAPPAVSIMPLTKDVAYGWRVWEVDQERQLILIGPLTNLFGIAGEVQTDAQYLVTL